jgi:hypothetical protein
MRYREYGETGAKVSALGFGCMRFPMEDEKVKKEETIKILRRAIDLGINYFDSAVMYCKNQSETVLGEALEGRRDEVYVSTKNHYKGDDPKEWRKYLDQSLDRLGVEYIDFYHLHDLRLKQYKEHLLPGGCIDEALEAKKDGLIKHLCFSSHDDPTNIKKLIDTGLFEGILVQYNIFDRVNEDVISYATERKMGVSIMGTVGGGRLIPLSEKIEGMTPDRESTPALAIRFVLSNPGVTVALSGMNTAEMVEENVAAASREAPLSEEEKSQIADVIDQTKKLEGLYCTGCDYCMPCPFGVDIPANFTAFNLAKVWGLESQAKIQYKALGDRKEEGEPAPAWAAACTGCKKCESKCPQNIPIAEKMKEVEEALSG